ETLFEIIEHFGDVIAGRTPSLMDGHHGVHIVRMLEKLQRLHDEHLRSLDAEQRLRDRSDVLVES
ncbi:MAG TPA: hypothetical protein VJZ00_18540, partial [Thermoanaerobaculia bacterium]|nr:hypothetical protein [Thermoanaerobaculia bacterium]